MGYLHRVKQTTNDNHKPIHSLSWPINPTLPTTVIVFVLAALVQVSYQADDQTSQAGAAVAPPPDVSGAHQPLQTLAAGSKPPRGYCVRISRAIPESSRCFRHLVDAHQMEAKPPPPTDVGRQAAGHNNTNNNNYNNETSQATEFNKQTSNNGSPSEWTGSSHNIISHHHNIREELVYVRLETVGSSLEELRTQVVNERILAGVLDQLLYGPEEAPSVVDINLKKQMEGNSNNNNNNNSDKLKNLVPSHVQQQQQPKQQQTSSGSRAANDIRAQILDSAPSAGPTTTDGATARPGNLNDYYDGRADIGSGSGGGEKLADKCRLSMEKFLCRLVYPSCHFRRADVSALVRPPCREDCLLLRDSLCPNLNWPKFTRSLNRAFNLTLMAAINQLDLAVDGDPQARRDLLTSSSSRSGGQPMDHSSNHLDDHQQSKTTNGFYDDQLNSTSSASPSIHFYWPHEHSIARCESLPPLRLPLQTLLVTSQEATGQSPTAAAAKLEARKRSLRRPICSNAHLTRTIALSPEEEHQQQQQQQMDDQSTTTTSNDGLVHGGHCLTTTDGAYYEGQHNLTNTLIPCQSWASQWPHSHKSSELLFDNMREARNYCRNPGGLELKPWCYTTDPNVRWQYCDIKQC